MDPGVQAYQLNQGAITISNALANSKKQIPTCAVCHHASDRALGLRELVDKQWSHHGKIQTDKEKDMGK